jgi:hypothetical protein
VAAFCRGRKALGASHVEALLPLPDSFYPRLPQSGPTPSTSSSPAMVLFLNPSRHNSRGRVRRRTYLSMVSLVQPNSPRPLQAMRPKPTAPGWPTLSNKCATDSTKFPAICGGPSAFHARGPRAAPTEPRRALEEEFRRHRSKVCNTTVPCCTCTVSKRRRASHESLPLSGAAQPPRSSVGGPADVERQHCIRQSVLFQACPQCPPACLPPRCNGSQSRC